MPAQSQGSMNGPRIVLALTPRQNCHPTPSTSPSGKARPRAAQLPCQGRRAGQGAEVGFELQELGAQRSVELTENLAGLGNSPSWPRVGSRGARLSRSPPLAGGGSPAAPSARSRRPAAGLEAGVSALGPRPRHAPPGRTAAARLPAAGLPAAELPRPSALHQRPRRVSGGPA